MLYTLAGTMLLFAASKGSHPSHENVVGVWRGRPSRTIPSAKKETKRILYISRENFQCNKAFWGFLILTLRGGPHYMRPWWVTQFSRLLFSFSYTFVSCSLGLCRQYILDWCTIAIRKYDNCWLFLEVQIRVVRPTLETLFSLL